MTQGVGRGVSAACHTPVPPSPSEAPILTQSSAGIWAGVGGGGVTGWALTAWGLRGGGLSMGVWVLRVILPHLLPPELANVPP